MKNTDLNRIKENTKVFIGIVNEIELGFIQNMFTCSCMNPIGQNMEFVDIRTPDGMLKWSNYMKSIIDQQTLIGIYAMVREPWKLTWLKYMKDYLSDKDFAELLADAWIVEDNPNQDANVKPRELIKWFKNADKKSLMVENDLLIYEQCPDVIHLYRGVSQGRAKYGLSWTDDKEKAEWFRDRFNKPRTVYEVDAKKEDILAYFNTRNEKEYVLDVFKYQF